MTWCVLSLARYLDVSERVVGEGWAEVERAAPLSGLGRATSSSLATPCLSRLEARRLTDGLQGWSIHDLTLSRSFCDEEEWRWRCW